MTSPDSLPPLRVEVTLTRGEFLHYNWARAFQQPMLPFFLYTFAALVLSSLLGIFPAGRVYALAVLLPLMAYSLWIWSSARGLWKRHPELARPRTYTFRADGFRVKSGDTDHAVPWSAVRQVLETRPAFYLLRADGSGEILPKRAVEDERELRAVLTRGVGSIQRSSFL